MISIFAPGGIGEIRPGAALAPEIVRAVMGEEAGPLRDGDIVVVTSKIVSKAEGRTVPAAARSEAIAAETARTVARRGDTAIVRTHGGLTVAAAGVDGSNVEPATVLLLPADPDASARALHRDLTALTGARLGVVISDTAGRAWRVGQTDHAIGAAGIRVLADYAGRHDAYGNELRVTAMAIADELAAAADLVKGKLAGRPVAVVRGAGEHLTEEPQAAADLIRDPRLDLFAYGSREAVIAAVLASRGRGERFEEVVGLSGDALVAAVTRDCSPDEARVLAKVLAAAERSDPD